MKNIFVLSLTIFFFLVLFGEAKAQTLPLSFFDASDPARRNVSGWAWSSNIGWISFSCRNTATSDPLGPNGPCAGVPKYGVHILGFKDLATGNWSGYDEGAIVGNAWSDSVGWISFNRVEANQDGTIPQDLFSGKPYIAKLDYTQIFGNQSKGPLLVGFARALSGIGENWGGWIKLSDKDKGYGVIVPIDTSYSLNLFGCSWGGYVMGWISFSENGCDSGPSSGYPGSNYTVNLDDNYVDISSFDLISYYPDKFSENRWPAFNLKIPNSRHKIDGYKVILSDGVETFYLSFLSQPYSSSSIGSYQLYQSSTTNLNNPYDLSVDGRYYYYDPATCNAGSCIPSSLIKRNTTYSIQAEIILKTGAKAFYTDGNITTGLRKYPQPQFGWTPKVFEPNQEVNFFTNNNPSICPSGSYCSVCYGYDQVTRQDVQKACDVDQSGLPYEFLWSVPISDGVVISGTTTTSSIIKFNNSGSRGVSLGIKDPALPDYATTTKNINVIKPIPFIEERRP